MMTPDKNRVYSIEETDKRAPSPIESAVSTLMMESGISWTISYIGQEKPDEWDCDSWVFVLKSGKVSERFDYRTGLGHRGIHKTNSTWYRRDLKENHRSRHAHILREWARPVKPQIAGLVYSIIMDSQASNMSFAQWCDEFGMDTDSRKALATYEACQIGADKFAKLASPTTRAKLAELLAEY